MEKSSERFKDLTSPLVLGNKVRSLITELNHRDRDSLGGIPFSTNIAHNIENARLLAEEKLNPRPRIALGYPMYSPAGEVVGYQATTIMDNATPTAYERQYIGLYEKLNYVQGKEIVVGKDYRGQGYGKRLLEEQLAIAERLEKDWVTDVKADNVAVISLLNKYYVGPRFLWNGKSGVKMLRLGREFRPLPK